MKINVNWPYVAGLFDMRGYVHCAPNKQGVHRAEQALVAIEHTSEELMRFLVSNIGGVFYEDYLFYDREEGYVWKLKGRNNKIKFLTNILPYLIFKTEVEDALNKLTQSESVETNTLHAGIPAKIESELHGDVQKAQGVILAA